MQPASIILVRGVTQAALALISGLCFSDLNYIFQMKSKHIPVFLIRCLMGAVALSLGYYSLSMIQIGVVFSLQLTVSSFTF